MKTIIIAFVHKRTSDAAPVNLSTRKKYAYNTEAAIIPGDIIKSPNYEDSMFVMYVLPKKYSFFNNINGKLSCSITSLYDREIRPLVLKAGAENSITGHIVGHCNF